MYHWINVFLSHFTHSEGAGQFPGCISVRISFGQFIMYAAVSHTSKKRGEGSLSIKISKYLQVGPWGLNENKA